MDFDLPQAQAQQDTQARGQKRKLADGAPRNYLHLYETLPCQMLNAYGPANFPALADSMVWLEMSKPQKTGALFMSELCSVDIERRGVGINRALEASSPKAADSSWFCCESS